MNTRIRHQPQAFKRRAEHQPDGTVPSALLMFQDAVLAADMQACLERARWHSESFTSRAGILEALCARRSHVVVADCDSVEDATQFVRDAACLHPHAKVVIVTDATIADAVAARNPTAYICMAKPVLPRALLSVLSGAWRDAALDAHRHKARRRVERRGSVLVGVSLPMAGIAKHLASLRAFADSLFGFYDHLEPVPVKSATLE